MTDIPPGPGWWKASDGRYYPPELHPHYQPSTPPAGPPPTHQSFAPADGPSPTPSSPESGFGTEQQQPRTRRPFLIAGIGLLSLLATLIVIAGIVGPPTDSGDTAAPTSGEDTTALGDANVVTALDVAKTLKAAGIPLSDIYDITSAAVGPDTKGANKGAVSKASSSTTTSSDDNVEVYVYRNLNARKAAEKSLARGNEIATKKNLGVSDSWVTCSKILYLRTTMDASIKWVQVQEELKPVQQALETAYGPCTDPKFAAPDG